MRTYTTIVRGVALSFLILGMLFCVANTTAAIVDLTFGLRWGYTWIVIPVGIGMGLCIAAAGFAIYKIAKAGQH